MQPLEKREIELDLTNVKLMIIQFVFFAYLFMGVICKVTINLEC